jgi:hypothetical protein
MGALCVASLALVLAAAADPPTAVEVAELVKPRCGSCHQASLPTASARAVAVFDLDRRDWAAGLNARQLRAFLGRLGSKLDGAATARVRAFVDARLARSHLQ